MVKTHNDNMKKKSKTRGETTFFLVPYALVYEIVLSYKKLFTFLFNFIKTMFADCVPYVENTKKA